MTQANDLTDEQKKALLALGAPTGETAMVSTEVLDELLRMGLLYEHSPTHIDLTKKGESIYEELGGDDAYG